MFQIWSTEDEIPCRGATQLCIAAQSRNGTDRAQIVDIAQLQLRASLCPISKTIKDRRYDREPSECDTGGKQQQRDKTPLTRGNGALHRRTTLALNSKGFPPGDGAWVSSPVERTSLKRLGLTSLFQRPDVDRFSRLRAEPSPEAVLKFYRKQVDLHYSSETGITTMKVRAFRPDDAHRIAATLLEVGEARVNALNRRAYDDGLRVMRVQLTEAEHELAAVQQRLTAFRQEAHDIDPQRTSTAQIALVADIRGQLAVARAQLAGMRGILPSAPQYQVMLQRVAGLAAQVAAEDARMTGTNRAMAPDLGAFEELQLRQDFAAKRYAAAAAALESAREQAGRQQLFVVRVVEPNFPVKSLYPQRLWILATVLGGLLLVYGIGWLIAAGIREHAA